MSHEGSERAGLEVQLQQTFWTVTDQEPSVRRRFETQRPAAGLGDFTHRSVFWGDSENTPVEKPRVYRAIRADHDVFRARAG